VHSSGLEITSVPTMQAQFLAAPWRRISLADRLPRHSALGIRRKAEIVAAVQSGLVSHAEA
jgi:hypothetical protein